MKDEAIKTLEGMCDQLMVLLTESGLEKSCITINASMTGKKDTMGIMIYREEPSDDANTKNLKTIYDAFHSAGSDWTVYINEA